MEQELTLQLIDGIIIYHYEQLIKGIDFEINKELLKHALINKIQLLKHIGGEDDVISELMYFVEVLDSFGLESSFS